MLNSPCQILKNSSYCSVVGLNCQDEQHRVTRLLSCQDDDGILIMPYINKTATWMHCAEKCRHIVIKIKETEKICN